jgi:3-hydroxymyristoyl/3-hydroxydecanoyl-(acyl carrier protein) dehydratase
MPTRFEISPAHPALPGHFPGNPVVPGVVLLERVLDAARAALGREPELVELAQVKFLTPLKPGEQADVALEFAGSRLVFRVTRGGQLLAVGEFVLQSEPRT